MFLVLFLPMASLTKRPKSKFWVACFTDRTGRRLKRSTATSNRKEAQKIADEFEKAARKRRTALQARRVLSQLHREITGDEVSHISMRAFVDSWIDGKKAEIAPTTLNFYRKSADKFLAFLGEAANRDLTEVTPEHVIRFRNEEAKQLATRTVNHEVKVLRMLFRAARRDALISDDPAEFVKTLRQRDQYERLPFTVDQLRALLDVADPEWESMILCGLYTGQRLSDIALLTWTNVDLERNELRIVTRKTNKRLIIPLAPALARVFETMASGDDPDAPLHPRAHAIVMAKGRSGHLSNQFADLLAQAGLRKKTPHRQTLGKGRGVRDPRENRLSFHCLRHTSVTLLKEAGVPDAAIMALVGHDSVAMSQHYTHVGRQALEKAANSLPDITSFDS
jgi:Site-specific recombinase XerD